MSRCPSNFRENDAKRLGRALRNAGIDIARIELHAGKVVFFPNKESSVAVPNSGDAPEDRNSFDNILQLNK